MSRWSADIPERFSWDKVCKCRTACHDTAAGNVGEQNELVLCGSCPTVEEKKKLPSMKRAWKIRSTKSHFTDQCDCLSFLPCTKGSRVNLSGQQCFAPGCFPFFSNHLPAGQTYGRIHAGLYHSFHFFFSLCARNGTRFFQSGWASLTATRCKMWTALLAWSRSTELHYFWFEALIRRSYWMRALYVRNFICLMSALSFLRAGPFHYCVWMLLLRVSVLQYAAVFLSEFDSFGDLWW